MHCDGKGDGSGLSACSASNGLVRSLRPTANAGHHSVVAKQVRDQSEPNPVHQHLFEHLVLEQERMEHVTKRPTRAIPVSGVTVLRFRPAADRRACSPSRDLAARRCAGSETSRHTSSNRSMKPSGLAISAGLSCSRRRRDPPRLLQAKLADFVPGGLETEVVLESCFCHGSFLPSMAFILRLLAKARDCTRDRGP